MPTDRDREAATLLSTDSATIRAWAHEHDLVPMRHREDDHYDLRGEGTAGDRYERVSWEVFGNRLANKEYVVRYHGPGSDGPVEVVDRETAIRESNVDRSDLESRLDDGQTVTSEIVDPERATSPTDRAAAAARGDDDGPDVDTDQSGVDHASVDRPTGDQSSRGADVEQSAGTAAAAEQEHAPATGEDHSVPRVTRAEIGKDVVDAVGETVGMVRAVDEAEQTMYVASDPSLTDRIKAALDVGGADADDVPVGWERIDSVGRDAITLNSTDELDEARPVT